MSVVILFGKKLLSHDLNNMAPSVPDDIDVRETGFQCSPAPRAGGRGAQAKGRSPVIISVKNGNRFPNCVNPQTLRCEEREATAGGCGGRERAAT